MKGVVKGFWKCIVCSFFICCYAFEAQASHAMGADISYTYIGNNQYNVTISFYRDCDGISAPSSIFLSVFSASGCGGYTQANDLSYTFSASAACGPNGQEVSSICNQQLNQSSCSGGTLPGVQVYSYCGTIQLPVQCADWIVSYSECCRNSIVTNLNNPDSYDQFVFAQINNTIDPATGQPYVNNAPFFTTRPVPYFCAGQTVAYNHGAVDIDGDSLVYELIDPLDAYNAPIPYVTPYNASYPMGTTSGTFGFDTQTGQMSFVSNIQQVAVVTVLVKEYRNGVLVGSTMRDIQIIILPPNQCSNAPSVGNPSNVNGAGQLTPGSFVMCPGNNITFTVTATDPDGNNLNMASPNVLTALPGATFTVAGNGTPTVTGILSWTPTATDAGLNTFTVEINELNACPISNYQAVSYSIFVYDDVVITSPTTVFCNDPIQLEAEGGITYTWTPSAGLSATNIPNPVATPTVPTTYTVTTECGTDQIFIDVQPDFSLTAGADITICLNALGQLNAQAQAQFAPYSYTWTPPLGLSDPAIRNPLASPAVTTTYTVTAIANNGCQKSDDVLVTISGVAPNVNAFAEPDTVCPGGYVTLSYNTIPNACGLTPLPCTGSADPYIVGTGTAFGNTSSTVPPSIYGHFYRTGGVQMLFTAAELNALGIQGGTINEIAFQVAQLAGTNQYQNFSVSMACVTLSSLGAWYTGPLSLVRNPSTVTVALGWNNYVLNTGYDWDGVSNLLVQVCFNNGLAGSFTNNSPNFYTPTSFNSVFYRYSDSQDACSSSGVSGYAGVDRPNTRFSVCNRDLSGATVSWSPAANIDFPTAASPNARVFDPTTFIVDVNDGGCVGSAFVDVVIENAIILDAVPDTSFCQAQPVQLDVNVTGTPSNVPLSCGVNGTACGGPSQTYLVGAATGNSSFASPFQGNAATGARAQYLFRAAELIGAGFTEGIISGLALNIAFKNSSDVYANFSIKLGCTSLNSLTNFQSGTVQVFSSPAYNTVSGWNNFTFTAPYDWDGTSNMIVEICYDNPDFVYPGGDDIIQYSTAAFNASLIASDDFGAGCSLDNTALYFTSTTERPDIRFQVCPPPPGTFTYSWTPTTGLSNPNIKNPVATISSSIEYLIQVSDPQGCTKFDTVTINYYQGYDANMNGLNLGCSGGVDGSIFSNPIGGVSPYNFIWSTGDTDVAVPSDTVFNLTIGTYYLTVTDNNNCSQLDTFTLTVPPPLTLQLNPNNAACFGTPSGAVNTVVTGGTPPYRYLWSDGDTSAQRNAVVANTYSLTVTDASGCSISDSAVITSPAQIVLSLTSTDISCYGYDDGSASVTVTTGGTSPFTYLWNNGQAIASASGFPLGFATVTVTDAQGCPSIDSMLINEPDSFIIVTYTFATSCYNSNDGIAGASVQGDTTNYQFRWLLTPPQLAPVVTDAPRGPLAVEVTDIANGCVQTSGVVISSPAQIRLAADSSATSCFGGNDGAGSVSVVSGGTTPFTYAWNDVNGTTSSAVTGLAPGRYIVTVTDFEGCFEFDTISIGQPDSLSLSVSFVNPSCFGDNDGSISATVSGGTPSYSYTWQNSAGNQLSTAATIDNIPSGLYSLLVNDINNCTATFSNILLSDPLPLEIVEAVGDTLCITDGSIGLISINVQGGTGSITYNLIDSLTVSNSSGIFTSLSTGSYFLHATDNNNCGVDTTIFISTFPEVAVIFDSSEYFITLGEEQLLSPTILPAGNNYSFNWSPSAGLSAVDSAATTASPSLTTLYELTVTDPNGCSFLASVTVNVENSLILFAPSAFTPNGDGTNDLFEVYGVSLASIEVTVFDRWGEVVFFTDQLMDNHSKGWDGTFKNSTLPIDVYIYYVNAVYLDGQENTIKGSLTILK